MRTHYDAERTRSTFDLPTLRWSKAREVRPGLVLDCDVEGRIVAVEILAASEHLANGADLRTVSAA